MVHASDSRELVQLSEVERQLAATSDIAEIKEIRDKAEAVRKYIQTATLGLAQQNKAAEIKLRAERKAGRLLANMNLRGGNRRTGRKRQPLLVDLGVSRNQSFRWQQEASISDEEFEKYLTVIRKQGAEITSAGLLRLARAQKRKTTRPLARRNPSLQRVTQAISELATEKKRFGTVHICVTHAGEGKQPKISVDDIAHLPLSLILAPQAHLYVWLPHAEVPQIDRLFRKWDCSYSGNLVVISTQRVDDWQSGHNLIFIGSHGKARFQTPPPRSWFQVLSIDSPDAIVKVRQLIQKSSSGPYLELFGTKPDPVWTVIYR